jgi:hypothetical protein
MVSVILLGDIMLGAVMDTIFKPSSIMLSVIMLTGIILKIC